MTDAIVEWAQTIFVVIALLAASLAVSAMALGIVHWIFVECVSAYRKHVTEPARKSAGKS
jgi:hypothetical protein